MRKKIDQEHSILELKGPFRPSSSTPLFTDVHRVCETYPKLLGSVRAKNLDILLMTIDLYASMGLAYKNS